MTDYKQSEIAGSKWQRLLRIVGENPSPLVVPNATPSMLIVEEEVMNFGDKAVSQLVDNISVTFDEENPLHRTLYGAIDAIYTEERAKRDAAKAEKLE